MLVSLLIAGSVIVGTTKVHFGRKKQKKLASVLSKETNLDERGTTSLSQKNLSLDQVEQGINRRLLASGTALGLAVVGMNILSLAGLLYASSYFFQEAYKAIFIERKLKTAVVDGFLILGIVLTGNLLAGALMCTLINLAQKLLLKTEDRSQKSLVNIFGQQPRSVWILQDGLEVELPFEQIKTEDILVINTGEVIPADGVIVDGVASIDQHVLTGESQPAEKANGDPVFAATLVLSGRIHVQVSKTGADSVVAQIGEVLQQTTDFKEVTQARWVELVDRMAPFTLGVGALALPFLGPARAIGMLYSCHYGYSMRVIAPATMLNFLNLGSKSGILIKDGRSLELLNKVDTVVFDKTGTLTLEQPIIGAIHLCTNNDYTEKTLLTYAAAAEYRQTHPIARAILQSAEEHNLQLPQIENAQYKMGYGIQVGFDEQVIHVGSTRFMEMKEIAIPPEIDSVRQDCHEKGQSLIMVAVDNELAGAIELHTAVRPEASAIIHKLQQLGMETYIISGDHEAPTKHLAHSLGIDHYFAETLPENKADIVAKLQAEGKSVCFIGDGINDSIALKQANVSISMNGATTIATDTAQIVFMDGSLKQLGPLFNLAKNYNRNLQRSFLLTLIPSAAAVGGILFLNFGLIPCILLYYTGLATGMTNTMLPLLGHKQNQKSRAHPL